MVSKAAERKLIKFFFPAIGQSNSPFFSYTVSTEIRPLWAETAFSEFTFSFEILASYVDGMFIDCLWPFKFHSELNISKTLS